LESGALAVAIASDEDVTELTEDHWKVINYLRDYYASSALRP
jgi:dissimilatory sulfite reductase related protein